VSYKVIENDKGSVILETDTNTEISLKVPKKEINNIARKLNLGSGFNNFTPSFFASYQQK